MTWSDAQALFAAKLPGYESRYPLLARTGLTVDQFWAQVDRSSENGCWPYGGSTEKAGYGRVWAARDFALTGKKRHVKAHRIAFEIEYGPTELHVLHRCDNPPCCRPLCLFAGTHADNSDDKWRKGRGRLPGLKGESCPWSKLTQDEVDEIRRRYVAGETQMVLARVFNTHQTNISLIVRGKGWTA